jgi:AcrR family transcriptional regulator
MKAPRIDIGSIRREQIVDAAVAVIAARGLQNLSLSAIEEKVGMSRGQLTYYFKAKEDILLAVFDRLVQLMCQHHEHPAQKACLEAAPWQEVFRLLTEFVVRQPPANPDFHALQYTFLSQIGHRADFRARLAKLYEEWRGNLASTIGRDLGRRPPARPVAPRAVATLIQAILHGLALQAAADPDAFDAKEMADLCVDVLDQYLRPASSKHRPAANGAAAARTQALPPRSPSRRKSRVKGSRRRVSANGVKP